MRNKDAAGVMTRRQGSSPCRVEVDRDMRGCGIYSDRRWETIGERLHLSPREVQCVRGIFDDRKEVAIAFDLAISRHTVHTYLERIYRKLGVCSRVELVLRVVAEFPPVKASVCAEQPPGEAMCPVTG